MHTALMPAAARLALPLVLAGTVPVSLADDVDWGPLVDRITTVCATGESETPTLVEDSELIERFGQRIGQRDRFKAENGDEIVVERFEPGGVLRRVTASYGRRTEKGIQPELLVIAGPDCVPQTARRVGYGASGTATWVERWNGALTEAVVREALDAPVADGAIRDGIPVAHVDAGVNYELPAIAERLARDDEGSLIGFDYWDMDPRPFDSNPARSAFFPQRHGTQTASLMLVEAPVATLAPFRYPRPDMARMKTLVDQAAAQGILIINLSLGSVNRKEWKGFAEAVEDHPEILFVVSAGNDGRDIDETPVYPAAFSFDNLLTVTSANSDGSLAQGSNWGAESVDLLLPAENQVVTDFHGQPKIVSGSSYAAVRIAALAACLLGANPDWRAPQLAAAILAMATPPNLDGWVRHGFIDEPTRHRRGACEADPQYPVVVEDSTLDGELVYRSSPPPETSTHSLAPTLVLVEDSGWTVDMITTAIGEAAAIYARCGVRFDRVRLLRVTVPRRQQYFHDLWSAELVEGLAEVLAERAPLHRPAVFFVRDTLQQVAFDAEAIGRNNARLRPGLMDTVWMTVVVADPGISLAHELYHVLANAGHHDPDPMNVMHASTNGRNTELHEGQCMVMKHVGGSFGNLSAVR